jgi:hypothetical protein
MPVEVYEVNHLTHPQAVDQVPEGSAENKREADGFHVPARAKIPQKIEDAPDGYTRYEEEKSHPQAGTIPCQKSKSSAGIPQVGEMNEVFHNLDGLVKVH